MKLMTGDSIFVETNEMILEYLVVSSEHFNLLNTDNDKVNIIVINPKRGEVVSIHNTLEDVLDKYNIKHVFKNHNSYERW